MKWKQWHLRRLEYLRLFPLPVPIANTLNLCKSLYPIGLTLLGTNQNVPLFALNEGSKIDKNKKRPLYCVEAVSAP